MSAATDSSAQFLPRTVELEVNGVSRTVDVDSSGRWTTTIQYLTVQTHTLLAKSGSVSSAPYSLSVRARPRTTEDWSHLRSSVELNANQSYTSPITSLTVKNTSSSRTLIFPANPDQAGFVHGTPVEVTLPHPATSVNLAASFQSDDGSGRVEFFQGVTSLQVKDFLGRKVITYDLDQPCTHFTMRATGRYTGLIFAISWI